MFARLLFVLGFLVSLGGCASEPPAFGSSPSDEVEWPPLELEVTEQAVYDCAERTDTGYVNGEAFDIVVVSVDGEPVERDTANAYIVMQAAAAADGVQIRINSGFRTMAEQEHLYGCYVNCNCNNCNLAARPGHSNHQSGHALDLNTAAGGVLGWLNAHGGDHGFERTVPSEDWHWEYWGGGPGGGPCAALPCDAVPAAGATLDDSGGCFRPNGPSQFWRRVDGEGNGGNLHWTNAFVSAEPDNWARWILNLEAAGTYQVEVTTGGPYGLWSRARYAVGHAGAQEAVVLDQSAVDGWQTLGVFEFAAGGDQFVDVYDNYDGDVPADQHILADAVRITPFVAPVEPVPDAHVTPPAGDGGVEPGGDAGVKPAGDGGLGADDVGEGEGGAQPPGGGDSAGAGGEDDTSQGGSDETGIDSDAGPDTVPVKSTETLRGPRSLAFQGEAGCQARPGEAPPAAWVMCFGLLALRRRRRT